MTWSIKKYAKFGKFSNPILVEGLPGIGNVGKVAVDFLVDELEAKRVMSFTSNTFPHSVFINESNLVEMPVIELYHKKCKKNDVLFLVGDVQPIDEVSCYEFCSEILKVFKGYGGREIIALGGIGLQEVPKKPKVYLTGNSKGLINKYKKGYNVNDQLYGVVGPIVGVSGLLTGMAKEKEIGAVCLLAETFGHPMYLGVKGAREILKIITKRLELKIDLKELDKEIEDIEKGEIPKELANVAKQAMTSQMKKPEGEVNYIG